MLSSQGLFLATAVTISAGTLILFDLFWRKYFRETQIPKNQDSEKQVLKSCLSSVGSKKRGNEKKKKRVQFAEDVKGSRVYASKLYRKRHRNSAEVKNTCRGDEILGFQKMPANRVALYSGILKDRVQRMEHSF